MRLTLFFTLLLTAALAQAEPRGLIAVLPLAETGGLKLDQAQRDLLEESLRTHAAEELSSRGYTVLTGENTLRVLQDNGIDPTKACEASCALDAAKELKASYFISGSINFVEGSYVVVLRMSEATAGRVLSSVQLRAEKIIAITDDFNARSEDFFAKALAGSEDGSVHVISVTPPKVDPAPKKIARELRATIDILVRSSAGESLAGSQILVDNRLEGTAPRSIQLAAGDHTIRVEKELFLSKSINLSLQPGEMQKLDFELKPDFGQIDISSLPAGANVSVDGIRVGVTPLRNLRLRTGNHLIAIEKDEYLPFSQQVLVKPGQLPAIETSLEGDFGPLTVIADPPGSEVLLDGNKVGTTPLTLERVRAGTHAVEVRKDLYAYESWRKDVMVARGTGAALTHIKLVERGTDVVISTQPPGARVRLDNVALGETSLKLKLLGGDYKLKLTKPGYSPLEKTIQVRPPEPLVIDLTLQKGGTGPDGRFTLEDLGLSHQAMPDPPVKLQESHQEYQTDLTAGQVIEGLLLGGGLGALAGLLLAPTKYDSQLGATDPESLSHLRSGFIGGGAAVGILVGIIVRYAVAPNHPTEVTDESAVQSNAQATAVWNAETAAARAHNAQIDRQLHEANAALSSDQ